LKKVLFVSIELFLALSLTLAISLQPVQAVSSSSTDKPSWFWTNTAVTGTEFTVDLAKTPAPAWLQLASQGLNLSGPANICMPYRFGQFNWVGEIHRLVDGKWVKLNTTNQWSPTEEGMYESCAYAPAKGTYALFGLYHEATTTSLTAKQCAALFAAPTYDAASGKLTEMIMLQPEEVKVTASVVTENTVGTFAPQISSGMTDRYIYWDFVPTGTWKKLSVQLSALGCTSKIYTFVK